MGIRWILFDMDNTLYPAENGLMAEIERRINLYASRFLGLDETEGRLSRRRRDPRYGTTLQWLQGEYGFRDVDDYMRQVHPADLSPWLKPDPDLANFLDGLEQDCAVLTNSPRDHALRVLEVLGVADRFPGRIYDLGWLGYTGKPHAEAFAKALDSLGARPGDTLLVEDNIPNLEAFDALGGRGILVGRRDDRYRWPVLDRVHDLADWLGNLSA